MTTENVNDDEKDSRKQKGSSKGKGKKKGKGRNKGMGTNKGENKGKSRNNGSQDGDTDAGEQKHELQPSIAADLLHSENSKEPIDRSPSPSPSPVIRSSPSVTASPPSAPHKSYDPLHCHGQRNRREIRDMTAEQRREWQQAILALRADRDKDDDSEWDRLVRLHITFNDEAHGGAYFLPWHRLFLLRLENALREKQSNLALPYWDWTQDADDAAMSRVWHPDFAGGAQRGNRPIQSGPFRNMTARYPSWHIVRRDFTSGTSGDIPLLWSMGSLTQLVDEESWADFADGIEAAHSLPHIYVGGDMSSAHRAPNDPMFYLHHVFADYVYALRQERQGRYQFGGTHDFREGTKPANAEKVLLAFGVPTSHAFNLSCVKYVHPSKDGGNIEGRSGRPSDDDVCANKMFLNGESLTKDRCRRGEEVLENTQ